MAACFTFVSEQTVEFVQGNAVGFELRPRIAFRIDGVGVADKVSWDAEARFQRVERFKRAAGKNTAKIP